MTAPGWYPDPSDPSQQRWWDGTAWGQHAAPQQPTPPPIPQPIPQAAPPAWGQAPQPVYAPPAPASGGKKGGKLALIIGLVVLVLAAAGAGAWFLLGDDDVLAADVTAKLEDNGLECDDESPEIERTDVEDLFKEDEGDKVPDEVAAAYAKIDDADATAKFTSCTDSDDDDRGAAFMYYEADGADIVVLVFQSDDDIVDTDEIGGDVGVLTVPSDAGTTTEPASSAACKIERKTIETALEAFNASEGYYPDTLDELSDYLEEIPSEDDWYYDSYGTVEPLSGGKFSEDDVADCE